MTIFGLNEFHPADLIPYLTLVVSVILLLFSFAGFLRHLHPRAQSKIALACMVVFAAAAVVSLILILLPRDGIALFAPGVGTGEEERYFAGAAEGTVTVRVTEEQIYLGSVRCADAADLTGRLQTLDTDALTVTLADDYAAAHTWHETEAALASLGLSWTIERLP